MVGVKEANGGIEEVPKEEINMTKKLEGNFSNITIIDVYDNVEFDPNFKTGFGFSCVIKLENTTILFDTGSEHETLLENMEKAKIKPEEINMIFLSHIHQDHVGGLLGFLEENPKVNVYVPKSFPQGFKNQISSMGAKVIEISKPAKIAEGIYSTGELGTFIKEQSLIISSEKGLIIISGCAHPGIVNIVKKAKELFPEKTVYLVMGGFHHPPTSVVKEFKKLGVEKVAPSHCTGDEATKAFEKEYKKNFIKSGVGKVIEVWESLDEFWRGWKMKNMFLIVFLIFVGQTLGSLIGLIKKPKRTILYASLAFAASVMLCISFFQLIPESLKITSFSVVTISFFFGIIIFGIIDRTLPHINPELMKKEKPSVKRSVTMLVIGIALHNLPEGLAIGAGFALNPMLGLAIALAIATQDLPENIATIVPLYNLTKKRMKSFLITTGTILFELIGFIFGYYFLKQASFNILGASLAIAAGFMVYISIEELIPAARIKQNLKISIISIILGAIIVFLTSLLV